MKKVISVLTAVLMVCTAAFAQNRKGHEKNENEKSEWREKVRAEQVAFISTELNLTESEAQRFWPVYNDVQARRREAFKASGKAFKALQEGVGGEKTEALLDEYIRAKKAVEAVEADALVRYKKAIPVDKVARLVLAEEKFRRQQIGKLGKREGGNRPGPAPEHRQRKPGKPQNAE